MADFENDNGRYAGKFHPSNTITFISDRFSTDEPRDEPRYRSASPRDEPRPDRERARTRSRSPARPDERDRERERERDRYVSLRIRILLLLLLSETDKIIPTAPCATSLLTSSRKPRRKRVP
jgi:hypothetical protein